MKTTKPDNWQLNFKSYVKYVSTELIQFENGKEWDEDEWNMSYIAFKENLSIISDTYKKHFTDKQLVTNFVKEFYQDASPATHSYWLKHINGLDRLIYTEKKRKTERKGFGIAFQDFQYNGKWPTD